MWNLLAVAARDVGFDSDDSDKSYRWSGTAWVAAAYDVATWSKIVGDGKPADNATVGATWGSNITNQPASLHQIFYAATAPASRMHAGETKR